MPDFSVIIPTYNEQERPAPYADRGKPLVDHKVADVIVVVASEDDTMREAEHAARDLSDKDLAIKAVRVEGQSVALFRQEGKVYATDNQCPHMGYPLTRGVVRNGVLTCDWHGYSYDLAGGGCFTGGCDDLRLSRCRCGTAASSSMS